MEQGLTISETILLKYKRSNELRTFFENCYQTQNSNVKDHQKRIDGLEQEVAAKESRINELTDEVNRLEVMADHFKDEVARVKEKSHLDQNKLR